MKCPVCGHESDGKFCENCGSPLTQNNTQENATNSVDSFGQNPTPEQPNYDSVPPKGFKMYCKKGSVAEAYAKENNLSYEIIK